MVYFCFFLFVEVAARETLEQVMADALWKSGSNRSVVRAVCRVVSGVNHPTDQQRILDWLSHVGLYVKNDAVIALVSGTMGKLHGCVLITATGTIANRFSEDGGEARVVGARPVLGDWGSGYEIVAHALTAIIKAHDGRGAQTMLVSGILESIGLSSPNELIRWTYADPSWARIAALHKHLLLKFLVLLLDGRLMMDQVNLGKFMEIFVSTYSLKLLRFTWLDNKVLLFSAVLVIHTYILHT
ncbi:hypothetical protein UlMin_025479 [Ulmus minor]